MKNRLSLLAVLAFVSWLPPAQAGLFDDDEARRRVEQVRQDLDQRIQKIQASNETLTNSQLKQASQIEALRQDLANLLGQVEVLINDVEQDRKRQKDFYVDLDTRLRYIESTTSKPADTTQAPVADPAQESRDYEAAIKTLRSGKHVDAAQGFKLFIKNWPKSGFLPGAHFWLGASLIQARDFDGAREAYAKMASTWPDDVLAPDAMLGQANAEQELGNVKAARSVLEKLLAKYPTSEAAKTAKLRLKKK